VSAVPSIGRASRVDRPAAPGADAASELYERYSAQIFGYCFHQLGSREEAEDAVQTTFMNAFRGLARGIVPAAEQAWVFKIAHNVCLSRRRSSWRRGRVEAPNNMEVLQEVVPAKEKVADELIRLQDVLEEMPDNQRRAILLREWQGLSYREIAAELELSQAAVETLIFRARRALASGLEDAPLEHGWRKRLRRGADVGGAVAFLKTLLGGGGAAAVKVATMVALAGATVITTAADRMHPQQRGVEASAGVDAAPLAAQTATTGSSASFAEPGSTAVTLGRVASRALRAPAPHATAPSSSSGGTVAASPPPASTGSQPAPAAATEETTSSTEAVASPAREKGAKPHTTHGRPADPGPPAAQGNPGQGQGKGRQTDPPVDPTAPPPSSTAATAPGSSGDHGRDTVGQENKADTDTHGNGRGK
jgi:RNA polymerase sigma factor (sigma-70 family)